MVNPQFFYLCAFKNKIMELLDIIIAALLIYAVFKGIQNGLFVELASFFSLIAGIYLAIKFSFLAKTALADVFKWNPYTIQVVAFVLTFLVVIIGISLAGKFLTKVADFAYLGWINKAGGGFFRMLKTVLILSIAFSVFEKINYNHFLAKKETLDHSVFFNPIQKTGDFIFPSLEKLYHKARKK
jgi:membrane protein required for colicin V production